MIWTHSLFCLFSMDTGVSISFPPAILDLPLCPEPCLFLPKQLMFGSREMGEASGAGLCSFPKVVTRCLPEAFLLKMVFRTSLAVQGLGLCLLNWGCRELRSYMPLSQKKTQNMKQKQCCNKFIKTLKKWSTQKQLKVFYSLKRVPFFHGLCWPELRSPLLQ